MSLVPALAAQDSRSSPPVPLFDGNSLSGWSTQDGPESAFYVKDGSIAGSPTAEFPAWLRSANRYENFDLELDFFLKGWMDGGVYFAAPEHGFRKSTCGFKVSLFHQVDADPRTNSMGSVFPLIAPRKVNVRNKGEWNQLRIRMDWPKLQVWSNGEVIHDLDVESNPELRWRLRSGYIGLETLSYPLQFRNIRIRELPSKQKWEHLYYQPADIAKWKLTEPNQRFPARYDTFGPVLRGDGLGNLTTLETYKDFALEMYIRGVEHHNGGILFRSKGGRDRYEIQLHDVEEAHYPTGSLYFHRRAKYPAIAPEQWYLFQLIAQGPVCLVRINGETVLEFDKLENLDAGAIELQAHQNGKWIEYKQIRIRRL
ncbi:MAG: DUF1080 domain-containing protein [Bryobacteraceae bacterium]